MAEGIAADDWLSFHVFYHGDRNLVLRHLLAPVTAGLVRRNMVRRFFFVRYPLGGPHIRWRVQPTAGHEDLVETAIREQARAFFQRWPSRESAAEKELATQNAAILASAPLETDDRIHPDNSLDRVPFVPEIDRYGGPELLEVSLDFFTISSVVTLELVLRHGELPHSRQLPSVFRLLLRQALAFSRNEGELRTWVTYDDLFHSRAPKIVEAADRVFLQRTEQLLGLFDLELGSWTRDELDGGQATPPQDCLRTAGRLLERATRTVEPGRRRRILASHLHMTANRAGLPNQEEMYLCRLLENVLAENIRRRGRLLGERWDPPSELSIRDLIPAALENLTEWMPCEREPIED